MQTQKKKISPVEKIMKLVDDLTPRQQAEVQRKLRLKDWGKEWDALKDSIEANRVAKKLPRMTEEEVYAEFTAHRRAQRAKRAKSSR